MRKRAVSFILCLYMVLSLLPLPISATGKHPFTDVASTDWFNDSVQYVYDHGLMNGTTSTTFAPYRTTQRGMIVTILYRLESSPAVTSGNPFNDVPKGSNYEAAITWAVTHDVVRGYNSTSFGPYDDITRQQMATILYRYAQMKNYRTSTSANLSEYADADQISDYAKIAMSWANGEGLINGNNNKSLMPTGNATRAQAAAILTRFCKNVVSTNDPVEVPNPEEIDTPTLPPKESDSYTVNFDLNYNDSGLYQTLNVKSGEKVVAPADPSRDSYDFIGWYTAASSGKKFNFNSVITADTTLYARWNRQNTGGGGGGGGNYTPTPTPAPITYYTVTFDSNGGSAVASQSVQSGKPVTRPSTPSKGSDIFVGWYSDNALSVPYDFASLVTSNLTLYAKWDVPQNETTYSRAVDEEHITEAEIEYDGEFYNTMYVDNELILTAEKGVSREQIEQLVGEYDANIVGYIQILREYQVELREPLTLDGLNALIADFANNDLISDACLNTVSEYYNASIPTYPDEHDDWGGTGYNQGFWNEGYPYGNNWGWEAINVASAWNILLSNKSYSELPDVTVGIIDSMFDMEHEDVEFENVWGYVGKVFKNMNIATERTRALATSANNRIDYDHYAHGTHVAGIIGANVNGNRIGESHGITGIAINAKLNAASNSSPGENATHPNVDMFTINAALSKLMESSQKSGSPLDKKIAINFSQVSNHSKQDVKYISTKLNELAETYDFLIVVSAGNTETEDTVESSAFCAVDDEELTKRIVVVTSGYSDDEGNFQSFYGDCNYGQRIDVAAPGGTNFKQIYSTVPPNDNPRWGSNGAEYKGAYGTSQAAPHVTGLAALIWVANPELSASEVKEIICNTADIELSDITAIDERHGKDPEGHVQPRFMVNAAHAVAEALGLEYKIQGTCGDNLSWLYGANTKTLSVSGNGQMVDFDEAVSEYSHPYDVPWYRYSKQAETIVINDGVTSIGAYAFTNRGKLKEIKFGNTLERISDNAFKSLNNTTSVLNTVSVFPASLKSIGKDAFAATPIREWYFSGLCPEKIEAATSSNPSFSLSDGTTDGITLYYLEGYEDNWDPDGDGKWMGYNVESYALEINGSVVDRESHSALADARVDVYAAGSSDSLLTVQTNNTGQFSISFPNIGTYRLKFSKDGYQDMEATVECVVTERSQNIGIVQMPRKPIITGTVRDSETNYALPDVDVLIYEGQNYNPSYVGKSNADGAFSVEVNQAGTYYAVLQKDSYESKELEEFTVSALTHSLGTITMRAEQEELPTISGVVQDSATQQFLSDVDILVYADNGIDPASTGKTDGNGAFSITLPQVGTYTVVFRKTGYEDKTIANVVVITEYPMGIIPLKISGGNGTRENPYVITTAEEFNNIRNNLSAHYVLGSDIDLSSYNPWIPLGNKEGDLRHPFERFTGSLDGNGHTITGLKIAEESLSAYKNSGSVSGYAPNVGLFAQVNGTITNLVVDGASVKIHLGNDWYHAPCIGIIAGILENDVGLIEHCTVSGLINIEGPNGTSIGGIVGSGGNIRDCVNNSAIVYEADCSDSYGYVYVAGISGGDSECVSCVNNAPVAVYLELRKGFYAHSSYYDMGMQWWEVDTIVPYGGTQTGCSSTRTVDVGVAEFPYGMQHSYRWWDRWLNSQ